MTRIRQSGEATVQQRMDGGAVKLSPFIPLQIRKRGVRKVVIRPSGESSSQTARGQFDSPMLVALARAFYWQQLLDDGVVASGTDIAQRDGLHHSTVNELLRLTLLEPAIIQAILAGSQPRCMSLIWFQRNPLLTDWVAQREVVVAIADAVEISPSPCVFIVLLCSDISSTGIALRQGHVSFHGRLPLPKEVQGVLRADELSGEP